MEIEPETAEWRAEQKALGLLSSSDEEEEGGGGAAADQSDEWQAEQEALGLLSDDEEPEDQTAAAAELEPVSMPVMKQQPAAASKSAAVRQRKQEREASKACNPHALAPCRAAAS